MSLGVDSFGLAEVFIWGPSGSNVGHVSIKLDDGTYVSFWPSEGINKKIEFFIPQEGTFNPDYLTDVQSEGGNPPEIFKIDGLDEQAMKSWFDESKNSPPKYCMPYVCHDAVSEMLKVGGLAIKPSGFKFWQKFVNSFKKKLKKSIKKWENNKCP